MHTSSCFANFHPLQKKSGHDTSLLVPGGQRPSVGVLSPFPEEENDIEMEDFDDDEIDGLIGKQPVHSPPVAKDAGTMKRTTLQLRKKWTGLEGLLAEPPPTSWIHSEVYEQLSQENQVSPPLNDVPHSISIDAIVCTYVLLFCEESAVH